MATRIVLTTTGTNNWTVPSDWNNSSNTIEVIGAGGDGATGGFNAGKSGGAGGGYGKISNQTLTPGASISYTIADHGSVGDTYWNGASYAAAPVGAHGGQNGGTTSPSGGSGKGTVNYTGGGSYYSAGSAGGWGGGGAAGPNGSGVSVMSSAGGNGDNGSGGSGGSAANVGGNGTEYTIAGSGGGGGGGGYPYGPGANGGNYGAGGGGGSGNGMAGYGAGSGTQGIIVITYLATGARYWVGGTGTWDASSTTHWSTSSGGSSGASAPNALTTAVYFDANSGGGVVTVGANYTGILIDCTGFTGTITMTNSITLSGSFTSGQATNLVNNSALTVGTNLTFPVNCEYQGSGTTSIGGNLFIGTGVTFPYSGTITFTSTSSGNTITSNAVSGGLQAVVFNGIGGSWTLQDNLTIGFGQKLTITNGTLILNGKTLTCGGLSNAGTLNIGSSTIVIYGFDSNNPPYVWNNTGTISSGTSVIQFTGTDSNTKTFSGGGSTYNNFYITGSGIGTYIIKGNNTFNDFKCDTPPHTIQFTANSTQTLNTFTVNGTAGNLMTLQSTVSGSPWYLVKNPTGVVSCDYLSLQDSHVS